jgi:uncharacterized protein
MIERAEYVLRDLGFYDVRVRHHELGPQSQVSSLASKVPGVEVIPDRRGLETSDSKLKTHLARIEVGPAELPKLLVNGGSERVATALKAIGYAHVTVDLQGYRRGSLNELANGQPGTSVGPAGNGQSRA